MAMVEDVLVGDPSLAREVAVQATQHELHVALSRVGSGEAFEKAQVHRRACGLFESRGVESSDARAWIKHREHGLRLDGLARNVDQESHDELFSRRIQQSETLGVDAYVAHSHAQLVIERGRPR